MNAWEEGFIAGLKPEKPLSVSEWSDTYRILSSKASSEPGKWRTSRTPYLKEPMDCLGTQSPIQRVVLMFAAQTGKTEAQNCWLGYVIDHAPAPMLLVQPTVEMGKRLSKQRLESMINDTPCLNEKIAPARTRDSGNTLFSKEFPGGMMLITGANSATGLRSTPCRYISCDEVDAFPSDASGEGDPVALAEKRATTFSTRKKVLLTSTPTIKDFSRIEAEYLASDQRLYYVPCPICGEYQDLRWKQLQKDDVNNVKYKCIHCEGLFDESHKTKMLRKGEWRANKEGDGITAGFRLNGLYSPLGWFSWKEAVMEFNKAKGDAPLIKTFVNTRLAETFETDYVSAMSAEGLLKRCESYEQGTCPDGVLFLTQGVDCQIDRLEVSTWGWGKYEESYLIDHVQLWGDPHQAEVWKQLEIVINQQYEHENGKSLVPVITAVDSGGLHTSEVYQFAREKVAQGVIAIKGQSQANKPAIGRPTRVDINFRKRNKAIKKGGLVYPLGVDTIKNTLMGRLKNNKIGSAGYIHFHASTSEEYFKQITAERQILKTNKSGFQVPQWVKKGNTRNECLDTWVYSYAAMCFYISKFNRNTVWQQLENKMNKADNVDKPKRATIKTAPKKDFVNSW